MRYVLAWTAALSSVMAGAQLRTVTPDDHKRALVHDKLGWESLAAEQWDSAEREFARAIDLDPSLVLSYYGLGKTHMATKKYRSAVAEFSRCRDAYLAIAGARTTNQLDLSQRRQERIDELREMLRVQQNAPQTSRTALNVQRIQQQITDLERLRASGRGSDMQIQVPAGISLALGSAYFRSESFAEAEREYQSALRDRPDLGEAHNNLAVLYMLTGRLDESFKQVALAEKAGFRVNPQFKKDLADKSRPRH